jgi:hypothetical protein
VKYFIGIVLAVSIGCAGPATVEQASPRFIVLSKTHVEYGTILLIKDTVTQKCMATHAYSGVMSWGAPCDQQEFDTAIQRQMEQMMQQIQILPSSDSNLLRAQQ